MLTPAEKRFIRSWEEQRQGGRWSYFFLNFLAAFFISTLVIFIVLLFFLQLGLRPVMLWLVPSVGLIPGILVPVIAWSRNERRWKMIIRREINHSQQ